jgi:ribosome-binding protein aMBF1 (putative translation factor)
MRARGMTRYFLSAPVFYLVRRRGLSERAAAVQDKFGLTIRARRRALDLTQLPLALAIGRSQAWLARLEKRQCVASEADKRRLDKVLSEREETLSIPHALPRRNTNRGAS